MIYHEYYHTSLFQIDKTVIKRTKNLAITKECNPGHKHDMEKRTQKPKTIK